MGKREPRYFAVKGIAGFEVQYEELKKHKRNPRNW